MNFEDYYADKIKEIDSQIKKFNYRGVYRNQGIAFVTFTDPDIVNKVIFKLKCGFLGFCN